MPQAPGIHLSEPDRPNRESFRRQQTALTRFGSRALTERNVDALLREAALRAGSGLNVERAKVLQYLPEERQFLVRAGVGWDPGVVGSARLGADAESPAGFAFLSGQPVVTPDLREEQRFRYPELLRRHGVVSAVNVVIQTADGLFGVLEADHGERRDYHKDEVKFLHGFAHVLAAAIDRSRQEDELKAAMAAKDRLLVEKELLLREVNHRVKNNLATVSALLQLQSNRFTDTQIRKEFDDALGRIQSLALVHDRLFLVSPLESVPVARHLERLCEGLRALMPSNIAIVVAESDARLDAELVVPLSLVVNELVTNAIKYAFPDGRPGRVEVAYTADASGWRLIVADDGRGLPANFRSDVTTSLGMLIVNTLARQLEAEVRFVSDRGTRVELIGRA